MSQKSESSKVFLDSTYFKPHDFKVTIKPLKSEWHKYRIIISPIAFRKMALYVDKVSTEVGWMGFVTRPKDHLFMVEDVTLLPQGAHAATTEISEEGLHELVAPMMETESGIEQYEKMKLWSHSHVNMGVSPSGQDDKQALSFGGKGGHDWFIRSIHNKKGDMKFDLYMFNIGVMIEDVPWQIGYEIANDNLNETIDAEIKEKVKPISQVTVGKAKGGGYDNFYERGYWSESAIKARAQLLNTNPISMHSNHVYGEHRKIGDAESLKQDWWRSKVK